MKKAVAITLIIILIIAANIQNVFATEADSIDFGTDDEPLSEMSQGYTKEDLDQVSKEGTSTTKAENGEETLEVKQNSSDYALTVAVSTDVLTLVPLCASMIMTVTATNTFTDTFTIQELLCGKYDMFDINTFDTNPTGIHSATTKMLRENTAIWFVSLRNIAIVGIVIILVYIGIKMSIAIIAEDKAKYKNMLIGWFIGLILTLTIEFLILLVLKVSDIFVSLIAKTMQNNTAADGIEKEVVGNIWGKMHNATTSGERIFYFIEYGVFVFFQIKFFIIYLMRTVKVYFYTIVSPLICMTYSIDRIKDNKSQAFKAWVTDFCGEIFMQPIELAIYTVFIYSASEIIRQAPLLGIIFIFLISKGEQLVKKALRMNNANKGLEGMKISKLMSAK